jgi:hypothetical protein
MREFFPGWLRNVGSAITIVICCTVIIGVAIGLLSLKVGSHPVPRPAAAKMRLNMADAVLKSGDEPRARFMFRMIIEDYGDLPAAQEAKERLERIGKSKPKSTVPPD